MKSKIFIHDGLTVFSELEPEMVASKMRSGNVSGSVTMKAYLDEEGTQEIILNINMIIYVEKA